MRDWPGVDARRGQAGFISCRRRGWPSSADASSSSDRRRYICWRASVRIRARLAAGPRRAHLLDLHDRPGELHRQAGGCRAADRSRPRSTVSVAGGCRGGSPALVGQGVGPPAVDLVAGDEALVGELLEGRVDRAGARAPASPALRLELLDDLVAVHRLLLEDGEDERADLAAPDAPGPAGRGRRSRGARRGGWRGRDGDRDGCRDGDRGDGSARRSGGCRVRTLWWFLLSMKCYIARHHDISR